MDKIPAEKQLMIVRLYFSGLSYEEIASQCGVAKGTVANVVKDLKAGRVPEAKDLADQVEALRELSSDLRRANLSVGQAAACGALLDYLQRLNIEPSQFEQWAQTCKSLTPHGVDASAFVHAAMSLEQQLERTGLSFEELENRASALEDTVTRLTPQVQDLDRRRLGLDELERHRQSLDGEVDASERRLGQLRKEIAQKEKRESEVSRHVQALEERTHLADERLASARGELQRLATLGFVPSDLTGFVQRVNGVAQRHGIKPEALRDRLFHELEALEAGLGLESQLEAKERKLSEIEGNIENKQQENVALGSVLIQLRQQQESLNRSIKEEQMQIVSEIHAIVASATEAGITMQRGLKESITEALGEMEQLKEKTLEVGKELGRLEATIEANQWLKTVSDLVKGNAKVDPFGVRTVSLAVLRGFERWLRENKSQVSPPYELPTYIGSTITELEHWKT